MLDVSSKDQEPAQPAGPESPPSYTSAPERVLNEPPSMRRHNFLFIKREFFPVHGTWVINPELTVPEAFLPPIPPNTVRKNLKLVSDFRSIDADIWVVPGGRNEIDGRVNQANGIVGLENCQPTTIEGCAGLGCIMRMHVETPFQLKAGSEFWKVTVGLPRTFTGPVTFKSEFGKLILSPAIEPRVTIFSDVNNTVKGFFGDFEASGYSQGDWKGSSLELTSFWYTYVYYLDELDKVQPPQPVPVPQSQSPAHPQSPSSSPSQPSQVWRMPLWLKLALLAVMISAVKSMLGPGAPPKRNPPWWQLG
ncbi:hypothetical protein BD410DRAFT_779352 [Rickenella mellea]|uniref:DUF7330 domain-containing protein n=1 Tax=Rickenella mellea TaxID=50990 RepID=A0A4R5XDD7_9AGAM|nr:hypothetical protein BD410DRAFT_779352 [Rickenella mellea]